MAEVKIAADSGGGSVGLVGPASTTGNVARQITLPDVANGTLRTTTTPGAILQVVSTTSSTNDSTTDNWDQTNDKGTNIGPTLSITPSSTSSKIIINWSGGVFLSGGSQVNKIGMIGLWNETTDTMLTMGRVGANIDASGDDWGQGLTITGLDSPSSTSAQVYTLQAGRYSGTYDNTISINTDSGFGPKVNFYAMEIAG